MKKIFKTVFLFATMGLFFSACSVVEEVVIQNETVAETYETFTVDSVSFNMVFVKGGTFTMGATGEQSSEARENEKPSHQVTLSDFYIGETEVTQELYQTITGKNYSTFKGKKYPATNLRYKDVQAFIEKLNQKTGQNFRLPTEAEWEYAARGGNKSKGYKYSGSDDLYEVAWCEGIAGKKAHAVKTKKANELGIYDMSGNVFEWCSDWFGNYSPDSQTNPQGPAKGFERVMRGGYYSYLSAYENMFIDYRVSARYKNCQSCEHGFLGFRLVLTK